MTGICGYCGANVPMHILAEHLAEHDLAITARDVRNAPVIDRTDEPMIGGPHEVERQYNSEPSRDPRQ